MALSLASFFTLAAADVILANPNQLEQACAKDFVLVDGRCEARFSYEQGAKNFVVPKDLGPVEIEVIGAAGGAGGIDCGAGCTAAESGQVGRLLLRYSDLSSVLLKLFPGQAGANGSTGASGNGGGAGGLSTYKNAFDGGRGGNAGTTGSSGAGGGGGAATVLLINNQEYIAAGAGGGGGSANSINGSTSGSTDGRISTVSVAVNISENMTATYNAPAGASFVSSKLRWESRSNSQCGKVITPDLVGKNKITITANNESWGDGCVGAQKRVIGYLYYDKGSQGGTGTDSSCDFYCDGGGGGGGGGGLIGGAGGELYQAPNGDREAAGFGGSAGSNTPVTGPVVTSSYIDAAGSGQITIRYSLKLAPSSVSFLTSSPTSSKNLRLEVRTSADAVIDPKDITFSGSASSQTEFVVTQISKLSARAETVYVFNVRQLSAKPISGELIAAISGTKSKTIDLDQTVPTAQISIQPATLRADVKVYDVKLSESVQSLTRSNFAIIGTSADCEIGYLIGANTNFQMSLTKCTDGTFGLKLLANSIRDSAGNLGPVTEISSELNEKNSPAISVQVTDGEIPSEFLDAPVQSVFSKLDAETQKALLELGIYAPMAGAPTANLVTDLTSAQPGDVFNYENSQQIEVGSSVDLNIRVSPEVAASSDLIAFIQTGNLWQYLGRTSFSGDTVSAEAFGVAKEGQFNIRLVVIAKDVVTTMSLPRSFGQAAPIRISRAVTDAETNLGGQQVNLSINAIAPAQGLPEVVSELTPEAPPVVDPGAGLLELSLPTLNVGQPVANPAIGATGDDLAPSVPFDPLGTPEAVAQVVKTTATTVAVVSSVAAAAAAAAGAATSAAGTSSAASSSASVSATGEQSVAEEDGEIANIDAQVETFTSAHTGWGDRIPIFKLAIFTFLDKFSHDLTVKISKFSPVISKIVNDGAYLRAQLGSLWLVFPLAGALLAAMALAEPATELAPPSWQLFLAISVLGLFDAFSGLLATTIFVIGMIANFGISSVSDVRMMLGVIVMGFGPALISVAFRQIRKHFETGFSYFWDRLVDIAVLLFFTGWTSSAMVATLPALAGKTLSAANHVADFAFFLSLAVVIRILLEELATRSFAQRLDKINPTEVLETSQLQKVLSTLVRLGVFIFVTAAFMGNTWQVWLGSILFILPNIFSWFEDKLPNSPLLWKVIPTGLPGLAFSLVVAGYSSLFLGQWLGDLPDFAQWSFLLLPIPMFLVGVIGLFGREGKNGEERPIKKPRWRYVYRLGGIVMLVLTAQLAGVI